MKNDTIRRSDAIKALHEEWDGGWLEVTGEWIADNCEAVLNRLPSVDRPQGEWIPCSERLPNYREAVLVSTFWGVHMAERDSVKEDGTDDFWYLFLDDATARPMYVYAWMPLPEPWKGADNESMDVL